MGASPKVFEIANRNIHSLSSPGSTASAEGETVFIRTRSDSFLMALRVLVLILARVTTMASRLRLSSVGEVFVKVVDRAALLGHNNDRSTH